MPKNRRLLLVEDLPIPYDSLKKQFEAAGWDVLRAIDEASTLRQIEQAKNEENQVEMVVVDLGLPPGIDTPSRGGLPLIKKLRTQHENLPIFAYTSIMPTAVNYSYLVADLLPQRVSFIYLRRMVGSTTFADLVELVWKGFFLFSPVPADHLPFAVANRPDPLTDDLWETLELISSDLAQKEVAARLGNVKKDAVKNRVARIKEILIEAGELDYYQADTRGIIDWYRTNYIRYRRFPK